MREHDLINATDETERQKILAGMYQQKKRPACPCKNPPIEMYIAKVGDRYIVKRMPDTGPLHSPDCESYEPPAELSGLGEVLGSAIKENAESGVVELRFDFSMAKMPGRKPIENSSTEEDSVRTDGSKLTLRSTLHYLWEQAGFNKWTPAMEGKRSWYVIRKHLIAAASDKLAKGKTLADQIYIPETFSPEKKSAIKQHWLGLVGRLSPQATGPKQLMILIGEVKEIMPARYGSQLIIKHAPEIRFFLPADLHKKMEKRFADELMFHQDLDDIHLIAVATFSVNVAGSATIEELALMPVTDNWIPFETIHDKALIKEMTDNQRRFTKGLRYNLPRQKPLASVVLSDTAPHPTACYILPMEISEEYQIALTQLQDDSQLTAWTWISDEYQIPDLPPPASKPIKPATQVQAEPEINQE